ncbi:unnamed protein product, partial [Onchocerca ochengi]|uniref:Presenilin n=1 Tax=Onchocerca ochengi TaxID=42157 RepID=A0A182E867_ONCOC
MGDICEEMPTQQTTSNEGEVVNKSRTEQRSRIQAETNVDEEEAEFKYGAQHVIHLFVPVSICMVFVIFTMNTVGYYTRKDGHQCMVDIEQPDVVISFHIYVFAKLQHTNRLYIRLYFNLELWRNGNDLHSLERPSKNAAALMALIFIKYLPEWTVWTVLAVISIWDLIAVLCPKGPLRILVETAQERNEPIFPALIYSSGLIYAYTLIGAVMMEQDTSCVTEHAQSDSTNP